MCSKVSGMFGDAWVLSAGEVRYHEKIWRWYHSVGYPKAELLDLLMDVSEESVTWPSSNQHYGEYWDSWQVHCHCGSSPDGMCANFAHLVSKDVFASQWNGLQHEDDPVTSLKLLAWVCLWHLCRCWWLSMGLCLHRIGSSWWLPPRASAWLDIFCCQKCDAEWWLHHVHHSFQRWRRWRQYWLGGGYGVSEEFLAASTATKEL